jgi:AraC family transcriptional regulator, transcriptional activator of pobA
MAIRRSTRFSTSSTLRPLRRARPYTLDRVDDGARLLTLCRDLDDEGFLARDRYRLALRALLALIAIEVGRLAASRSRSGLCTLAAADNTVEALRRLIEANFRCQRQLSFYAQQLA